MTTPHRGYTEIPGAAIPDVPYRVNLALREIDADVQDAVAELEAADAAAAGRLAGLEAAAGFGSGLKLQDDAVNGLLNSATSKTAATITKQIETKGPAATVAALQKPGTATREAFDAHTLGHLSETFRGPLAAWGEALRTQTTKPALWVSLGSSTANGGNTPNFGWAWVGRIATFLTGKDILSGAVENLVPAPARPAKGVHVYNGALGGTTSGNYLTAVKLAAIKQLQPTLITHMVGANDLSESVTMAAYKANLRNTMDQLQAATPGTVHLFIHQQGRRDASPKFAWAEYGKAMHEVADAYPNVAFLDASQKFGMRGGLDPHLVGDGLHMNQHGHRIMADIVAEAMGHPIPYAPEELYKATNLGSNGPTNTEREICFMSIPPAPYPRNMTINCALFMYGTGPADTQGPEASVYAQYPDVTPPVRTGPAIQIRVLQGGVGRALTYSAAPTYAVDANRPVEVRIVVGPNAYASGAVAYNYVHAVLSPV